MLTTFDDDQTLIAALDAGAAGFVLKDAPGEEIIRAIERVADGDGWLDPAITSRVLAGRRSSSGSETTEDLERLTDRELDVLRAVGRGFTNAEVAEELFISQATVKTHLSSVLSELDLRRPSRCDRARSPQPAPRRLTTPPKQARALSRGRGALGATAAIPPAEKTRLASGMKSARSR